MNFSIFTLLYTVTMSSAFSVCTVQQCLYRKHSPISQATPFSMSPSQYSLLSMKESGNEIGHVDEEIRTDMIAEADSIFDSIDTNKDGEISNDEICSYLEETIGYSSDSIRYLFTALDKNADGAISREELRFAFSNYDLTALYTAFGLSNEVTDDKYDSAVKSIRSSASVGSTTAPELVTKLSDYIFNTIDTDQSGEISTQELKDHFLEAGNLPTFQEVGQTSTNYVESILKALDINSDGSISREEMREGFKQYDPRALSKILFVE